MKSNVLFVLLDQFADWEYAFLAAALNGRIQDRESPYQVKTVSAQRAPIRSMGGLTAMPDYSAEDCPTEYAGLILIGGMSWRGEQAKAVLPLVRRAFADKKVVGAICDATVFLGMNGLLNARQHTSNTLEELAQAGGAQYTGSELYRHEQAVGDQNLITANGTGYLEFTREVLTALDAYPAGYIADNYQFFKQGYIAFVQGANSQSHPDA